MPTDDALQRQVYVNGEYRPFGELTAADARALAAQLRGVTGGGLDAKVGPVRAGWTELAQLLDTPEATVADLAPDDVARFAERLWVTPPGGTLLP
jgi:hypothetical protein